MTGQALRAGLRKFGGWIGLLVLAVAAAVWAFRPRPVALEVDEAQVLAAEHALLEARAALQQARSDAPAGARGDARSEAPTEPAAEALSQAGSAARSVAERRPAAAGGWALRSPVTGRVMRVLLESGGPVGAGDALLEIADTHELEAVIDVLSGDALRVPPGAAVQLSLGAGAAPLAGRVSRVEPLAFTKVSALGIEEQRVNLVIDFDGPAARAAAAAAASAANASGNGNGNAATASPAAPLSDGFRVDARVLYPGSNLASGQRIAAR